MQKQNNNKSEFWKLKYSSWTPFRCSKLERERERYDKLRRQVKQARAANKNDRCNGAVLLV